jgi:multimeric flavodoxin WrbA
VKIAILNGNPSPRGAGLDAYIEDLSRELRAGGLGVEQLVLREMNIGHCSGCFGCWTKTPGECSTHTDDGTKILGAYMNADLAVFASPVIMGFVSALLKRAMDRLLPLIHPYAAVDHGEAHHLARYTRYPKMGLLLDGIDPAHAEGAGEISLIRDMFSRTALNIKTRVCFTLTAADPVEEAARLVMDAGRRGKGYLAPRFGATSPGPPIKPPARLTLINGSPRGTGGNTELFLSRIVEGFTSGGGSDVERLALSHARGDTKGLYDAYVGAESVILGFPLYTDHMPGMVMSFIESLAPLVGREGNPPMGFLVQSGFPEALHSRYVERYLAGLAARLGSPYLGTIVKGGGEAVRHMPEERNKKTFVALRNLGAGLAREGRFDPALLAELARPERFPGIVMFAFRPLLKMRFATKYWDDQLEKNGVYERRFARPYAEA